MSIPTQLILSFLTITFSLIAIIFTFLNYRFSNKGGIRLDFVGYEKHVHERKTNQSILEKKPFFVFVRNTSNIIIRNLKLETIIIYKDKKFYEEVQELDYLNPHERVSFIHVHKNFKEQNPDLFKEETKGTTTFITPKQTLVYNVKFILTWKGLFRRFKQEDDFKIEWQSYDKVKYVPDKEHNSDELYYKYCISSYNKRNNFYIYKE